MASKHELLTQSYSTYGDKLLQHCERLAEIQEDRHFSPITVQLAPTEACDSKCSFCSVAKRPLKSAIPLDLAITCLDDFKELGAKSLELTGGGNPLLYMSRAGATINSIIRHAHDIEYKIGIITNSHNLERLDPCVFDMIDWIRISLAKLDEGKTPYDYSLSGFPEEKVGWSYIIHEKTTAETIHDIKHVLEQFPRSKFVRIAGNCLELGSNQRVKEEYGPVIDALDKEGKMFIKEIGTDERPFEGGCYVGMLRPYVAPSPDGLGYYVYTCTSHVLRKRTYDPAFALCRVEDVMKAWEEMNARFKREGYPYEVAGNKGKCWGATCTKCYYGPNNRLLHTVASKLPDADFA